MKNKIFILFIFLLLIFISLVSAHEDEEDQDEHNENDISEWIVHATFSVLSTLFAISILFTGAIVKGRFKKPKKLDVFKIHKILSISFFIIVLLTFFYGLYVTSQHNTAILSSIHGIVGLIIVILALLSVILSPCFSKKIRIESKKLHSILGYILLIVLIIQLYLGMQNVT